MRGNSRNKGFTLVELMIVIVIIGILAGVVLVNVGPYAERAKRTRALADIKEMDTVLQTYYLDSGIYPSTQQGLQALITKPTSPPIPRNWQGPYIRNRTQPPLDPWGNEYVYKSPGDFNADSFDLFSLGADGITGGQGNDADVVPWE